MAALRCFNSMNKQNHTATPWRIDVDNNKIIVDDSQLLSLAETFDLEGPNGDDEAGKNAAFIVQAVNAHDALVAVVQNILADCNTCHDSGDDGRIDCDRAYHMQARAALDLAEEN